MPCSLSVSVYARLIISAAPNVSANVRAARLVVLGGAYVGFELPKLTGAARLHNAAALSPCFSARVR
jgi:hypothetical protein